MESELHMIKESMTEEIKLLTENLEKALEERWKIPKEKIVVQKEKDDDVVKQLMAWIDKVEFEKSRAIEQAIENWKMYEALMSALK